MIAMFPNDDVCMIYCEWLHIKKWASANNMRINEEKAKVICFKSGKYKLGTNEDYGGVSLGDKFIPYSSVINYLGVTITCNLWLNFHVSDCEL